MKTFSCETRIVSGPGAVAALKEFGAKRVFLVTDPFFAKNGTARRVAEAAGGETVEIFDGVVPDPSVALAAEGTAKLKAFGPDLLVALGGGSAMDCAKAMAYFSQGTFPLAAIPTTSGSGSEVTDFAILTHEGWTGGCGPIWQSWTATCWKAFPSPSLPTRASMCCPTPWKAMWR